MAPFFVCLKPASQVGEKRTKMQRAALLLLLITVLAACVQACQLHFGSSLSECTHVRMRFIIPGLNVPCLSLSFANYRLFPSTCQARLKPQLSTISSRVIIVVNVARNSAGTTKGSVGVLELIVTRNTLRCGEHP